MTADTAQSAEGRPGFLRSAGSDLLVTLGVIALGLGVTVSVARRALFYPDAFAERLTASLADPRVAAFVADRMADAVLAKQPDLTAFRPLVVGTARGLILSSSFQALARTAARTAHAGLFSEGGRTIVVSVPDVGVLLKSALAKANPALAEKVPVRVQSVLASVGQSRVDQMVLRLWDVSRRSQWLAGALGLGGILLALAGVALAPDTRRALARLGTELLVAAILLFLLMPAGEALVASLPREEMARQAAAGLWTAFTGALGTWAFVLGGVGLVLQAAGHSLLERFAPAEAVRRLLNWLQRPPASTREGLLRGTALAAVGGLVVAKPSAAASLLLALAGAALAFVGLREIFEAVLRAVPEPASATPGASLGRVGRRAGVVLALAGVLVAGIAWFGRPAPEAAPVVTDACNGAKELCGRALDAVVFPGTHNAMSSADIPDWLFPQQERGIERQLEDGVRALLIDVHYGLPVGGRVKTDLDSETTSREKLELAVGAEGLAAAMRIRDRLTGPAEGPRALYLCHGFCELGAMPLVAALEKVHAFLVENPQEVLVFVVEDYVTAEDLAKAFTESGLEGLVYRGSARPPWPTLRALIDSRQRVVVLTESGRPGIPWIHPAFDVMQETPYRFKLPSELSCAVNRGGTAGSLFLVNNWIDTTPAPKPSNAAIVNAYQALVDRSRACATERGKLPTVLAVDFYRTGGLFDAVRTLNGLARTSEGGS